MLHYLTKLYSVVDCGPLTAPANGHVNTSNGTTFGSVATLSCRTGYTLNPRELQMVTCGVDGAWPTITCAGESLFVLIMSHLSLQLLFSNMSLAVDCGSLPNPLHGTVDISSGTIFEKIANYRCDTGYNLAGPMTRTCALGGIWTSNEPVCHRKFSITQNFLSTTVYIAFFQLLIVAPSMILTMDKWTHQMEPFLGVWPRSVVTLGIN